MGARGSAAVERLAAAAQVAGTEVWCLDCDRKALEAVAVPNKLLLAPEDPAKVLGPAPTTILLHVVLCASKAVLYDLISPDEEGQRNVRQR